VKRAGIADEMRRDTRQRAATFDFYDLKDIINLFKNKSS
jgi:hypothetical protein